MRTCLFCRVDTPCEIHRPQVSNTDNEQDMEMDDLRVRNLELLAAFWRYARHLRACGHKPLSVDTQTGHLEHSGGCTCGLSALYKRFGT